VASRLAHVLEGEDHVPRSDGDKINSTAAGVGKAPSWAGRAKDARDVLHWDSEQYVAEVLVGDHLALGVVDTGSCKTLMCENTAKSLGLQIERAKGQEFGTYRVPGGNDAKSYVGVVRGPLRIKFSEKVEFQLSNLRVL
jgi:hypothetical protein